MLESSFFDFPMTESSIWTESYCLSIYLLVLISNFKSGLTHPFSCRINHDKQIITVIVIGFAIITFCELGDFYHLMKHLRTNGFTEDSTNFGVEYIYGVIGSIVDKNYFLFRTIVFGGAYALYCKTAKRFGISNYYAALFMYISHAVLFTYARATLAMSIYFYGLSFICVPYKKNKLLGYVFGATLIFLCKEFHTSTLILIILTPTLFLPFRKWSILLLLISIPTVAVIFKDYFEGFIESGLADDYLSHKFDRYVERESSIGIARIIIDTLSYSTFYIPLLFSTIIIFFKNTYSIIPSNIFTLYKVTFSLMFVSASFLFFGETFYTFYYRTLYMSMIPLMIIVLRLYKDGYMSKKTLLLCVLPGIPHMIIRTLYTIYLGNLGIQ